MIILVGASASGKTEVAKLLARKYGISKAITHTTRAMRTNERNGVDYFFVSFDEFDKLKKENAFVETTTYNQNNYGTSKQQISDSKVLIVDPNGLKAFTSLNDPRIITFYLDASEEIRLERMLQRGDSKAQAKKRIENDKIDFAFENIGKTNFVIDTQHQTSEQVADEIYKKYIEYISLHY